ncbi:sulfatase [Vallitalea pronyensis]|uniref:Sulfatase n=2 Tax=Vallitalea pronyensis TaxID=1348613 RepID=A0A8J8MQV2_9FIRM|nr:sulfatase [Vallitalea pronyensis]QUI25758.1 sulfatase [Vallitalea pronyensis]
MKAIMVMFDSLNRRMLPNYGCEWIQAPNFKRLGEKTVTFDTCYVGSLPCMPARRELQTGRYNFLHRSWGPMEPFDDAMPEILKNNGIYTHITSDHQHYWEDGGCTYHTRYSSWEISRGQEGDPWKGYVGKVEFPETPFKVTEYMQKHYGFHILKHDIVNRQYLKEEQDFPQAVTFKNGLNFMEENKNEDNWFLQIETFDPHEPFFAPEEYYNLYPDNDYGEEEFDWPPYGPVMESDAVVQHGIKRYAALLSMCDKYLGKVLDMMDKYNMWEDTMLIVNTDHGYMLGEHGWWSKSIMPTYNEVAHIPLFIWDPRSGRKNVHTDALAQTIDIAPTLLEYFNVDIPTTMMGKPLAPVLQEDKPVRKTALFGYHGSHINITDGQHVYLLAPAKKDNKPLNEYTLMPTHMRSMFKPAELQETEIHDGFDFTKGCKLMKIPVSAAGFNDPTQYGTMLFDVTKDPAQLNVYEDDDVEVEMINGIRAQMIANDAPIEQYERMGLFKDREMTVEDLKAMKAYAKSFDNFKELSSFDYEPGAYKQVITLLNLTKEVKRDEVFSRIITAAGEHSIITKEMVLHTVDDMELDDESKFMRKYFIGVAGRTK